MKFCRHCGSEMQDAAAVCLKCGIGVNTPPTGEKAFCWACGAETDSRAAICVKCGAGQPNQYAASAAPLTRSYYGKIFAGICAGIGRKWNIDPWIIRAILIASQFIGIGFALDVLYIVLIFVLPYGD